VAPRPPSRRTNRGRTRYDDDPELGVLVTAKRMGLSFEELNMLTLDDYITAVEMWAGEDEDGERYATQEDIDRLLG
jgi:hypothetical protein